MAEPSAVEVKVNIMGDVDDALSRLGLSGGKPRRVWFLDDPKTLRAMKLLADAQQPQGW